MRRAAPAAAAIETLAAGFGRDYLSVVRAGAAPKLLL